jgi:hypothetical protein
MTKYLPGDHVVIFNDMRYEVGLVTNVRKKKNSVAGYDVRTERGSAIPIIPVGKSRTGIYIDPILTEVWRNSGSTTNMYIDKKFGHTRANYNNQIQSRVDGDDGKVGHFEKYNDFVFPTIGARSY